MGYWGVVLNVIKNADVILLVADARIPEIASNEEIIAKAEKYGKGLLLVFNKVDLVSSSIKRNLAKQFPGAFFVSAKKKVGISLLKKTLLSMADSHSHSSLRVGILGYPNTGKSSVLNLLSPSANAKVSNISGTTKKSQWVRASNLRFIDSPGVIPLRKSEAVTAMLSSKDPHKLDDPERAAFSLLSLLLRKYPGIINKAYGVVEGAPYDTFLAIARKKGHLLKKGEPNEQKTALMILSDWQSAKISLV